jgi:HD-GYP domain-containing protein (c-di-GMP phosphodiesterase class II)
MRLVGMLNAKPGDILGETVLTQDGSIMLRQGVALTPRYIEKLTELGIGYVYIEDDLLNDIEPEDPELLKLKSSVVKVLSRSFGNLAYNDTKLDAKETVGTITDLVEYFLSHKQISSCHLTEIKTHDNYTYVHSLNTCVLALFFGVQLNFTRSMLVDLGAGTILHDIGKTKIPLEVLNKSGKLTEEEFEIMKQHSMLGYELLEKLDYVNPRSKRIVLEHHERIDGSGYPKGLTDKKISKFAKIAAISDVYDAIVSDRVYRKGIGGSDAYEFILGGAGSLFDWELVNVFKNNFSIYPLGVCVKLSNGIEGFVVKDNKGFPDRPVIRVIYNKEHMSIEPYEIDLVEKIDVCIEEVII